ncbi:DUF5753 domain-containing protein [Lentzea nigeriaca]|uniref:DUF5753 domain-containing protein n=1 Tax=Lentzea nigeriaca TaxID=1128665 RepID=UPI00195871C6|nr:DUF5753 domain-containing protein [Lentzea nigeriaca]MBM7863253.1 hypothetical protein [Lentzea nigeriaca]
MGAPDERLAGWQDLLSGGMASMQHKVLERQAGVRSFRAFEPDVVPGLLQVPEYAPACLGQGELTAGSMDDLGAAVQVRMERQEILHHEDKQFHFVLTEASLLYRWCSPSGMLAQLKRLASSIDLPNVRLGVIGFGTTYRTGPWHGFWIFDEGSVAIETYSAELNLTEPHEIALYGKVFDSLAGIASYGEAARQIIQRTIDDLSAEVDEDHPTR